MGFAMNYRKGSLKQKNKHVVRNTIIHINRTSWKYKSPSQHFGATTKGISPYKITKCVLSLVSHTYSGAQTALDSCLSHTHQKKKKLIRSTDR